MAFVLYNPGLVNLSQLAHFSMQYTNNVTSLWQLSETCIRMQRIQECGIL